MSNIIELFKIFWRWFTNPLVYSGITVTFMVVVMGFILSGTFISYTNTTEFCVSCHEMSYPYEEYKKSPHYTNVVGVRAECPDCHVPKEYPNKLWAKVTAAKDVLHHILGTVDTEEKFEAYRLTMARRVWRHMETRKSKNCQTCHNFDAMIRDDQGRKAKRKHQEAIDNGDHCISCHKGVVHKLPKDYDPKLEASLAIN